MGRRFTAIGVCAGLLGVLVAVAPAVGAGAPAGCAASATVVLPAGTPGLDWAENLGYDAHGELWVSRVLRNQVQRYDRAGRVTATVTVASPGAVRLGPDGLMYVTFGDTSADLAPGANNGGVVRFDPNSPTPVAQTFVTGLGMANGAAFDAAGNLYVADTAHGVVRIRRDGAIDTAWTAQAVNRGANGIVVDGDAVDVTLYLSPTGRILRIPIADPSAQTVVADNTIGATGVSALPDDLTVGPDGSLYDATTSGSVVRIDPATHTLCTVYTGPEPLAAVAVAPDRSLLVSTLVGDVLRVVPV
jgi:sugar lactone lactonase YvrE